MPVDIGAIVARESAAPATSSGRLKRFFYSTALALSFAIALSYGGYQSRTNNELRKKIDYLQAQYLQQQGKTEELKRQFGAYSTETSSRIDSLVKQVERNRSNFSGRVNELNGENQSLSRKLTDLSEENQRLRSSSSYSLDDLVVDGDYNLVIVEKQMDIPFNISQEQISIAKAIGRSNLSEMEKARKIYDWVEQNISYGAGKRREVRYRNSEEVINGREGVCGEMAYLYITMARLAGLESNWVDVTVDSRGKRVDHACASVNADGRVILVDPAYHMFGASHQQYRILDDSQTIYQFRSMRH